jgi:hypothetical protein
MTSSSGRRPFELSADDVDGDTDLRGNVFDVRSGEEAVRFLGC